jgi:hypothetical protein
MGQTRYRLRRRILRKRSVGERLTRIAASNCGLAVHVKAYCIRIAGSRCIAILNPHISLNRTGFTRAGARDCELGGCLKSPVFQSARSASQSTCAVCSVHHGSVLSVKRTRTYGIPSSKTCSAQSTILPRTPRYRFPGLGKSLVGLSAVFFFFIGWPPSICGTSLSGFGYCRSLSRGSSGVKNRTLGGFPSASRRSSKMPTPR